MLQVEIILLCFIHDDLQITAHGEDEFVFLVFSCRWKRFACMHGEALPLELCCSVHHRFVQSSK